MEGAEMPQAEVREEVEGAEVVPPPSPARPPQHFRGAAQQRPSRHDQQRYREQGSPVHRAIQDVEHIIQELRDVLDEMEGVLETLELAEREKTGDERELEQLRRTLRGAHRGRDNGPRHGQGQRSGPGRMSSPPAREAEAGGQGPEAESGAEPPPDADADEPQPS